MINRISKHIVMWVLVFMMVIGFLPITGMARTITPVEGDGTLHLRVDSSGVLHWNNTGAENYTVSIKEYGPTEQTVKEVVTINSFNLTVGFLDTNKYKSGKYTVGVDDGDQSNTILYYYDSPYPQLEGPRNLRWNGNFAEWDAVPNADQYKVYLTNTTTGSVSVKTVTAASADLSAYSPQSGWFFSVVAFSDGDYRYSPSIEGPRKNGASRTITPVQGDGTLQMSVDSNGILHWSSTGAGTYTITIMRYGTNERAEQVVTKNSFDLTVGFLDANQYRSDRYIVTVTDGNQSNSIFYYYDSPYPQLEGPSNLRWEGKIAKWDAVPNADQYNVYLTNTTDGSVKVKTVNTTYADLSTYDPKSGWFFNVVAFSNGNYRYSPSIEGPRKDPRVGVDVYNITTKEFYSGGKVKLVTDEEQGEYESVGYGYDVPAYSNVSIFAQAADGYKFVEWREGDENGEVFSTSSSVGINVTEDLLLVAIFKEKIVSDSICDDFAEFKAAMEDPDIETVTLNGFTETLPSGNGEDAIVVQSSSGTKNLIISGSASFIQGTEGSGYTNFITVGTGITLNVAAEDEYDGLSVNPSKSGNENSVFHLDGGELHFTEDFTGTITCSEQIEGMYGAVVRVSSGNLVIENGSFQVYDADVSADRGVINTAVGSGDQEHTMITLLGGHYSYSGSGSGKSYVLVNSCDNVFVDKITYAAGAGFVSGTTSEIAVIDKDNYVAWNPFSSNYEPNFILEDLAEIGYLSFKYSYSSVYENNMLYDFLKEIHLMEYSGDAWVEVYNWSPSSNAIKNYSVGSCVEETVKKYKLVFDYEYELGGNTTAFTYERELRAEWKDLSYSYGSGTENDPVQVTTFEELRRALYDTSIEYVEVTDDIEHTLDYMSYSSNPGYDVYSKINDYRQGKISAEDLYETLAVLDVTDGSYGADEYLGNRDLLGTALFSRGTKHLILTGDVILDVDSFPYENDDTGFKYGLEFGSDLTISGGGTFSVKLTCPNYSKNAAAIYSSTGNHLVIEDATVKAETKQAAGYAHAIYMQNGSILIHDGEFYGQHSNDQAGYSSKFAIGAVYLGSGIDQAEINGGTFSEIEAGQDSTWSIAGLMIHEDALSKVTLNGGTYETGLMKVGSGLGSELSTDDMRSILLIGATYTSRTNTVNGVDLKRVKVAPSSIDFADGVGDTPQNPAYCDSYAELKYALEHPTIRYIVVNGFQNTAGLNYYALDYKTDYEKGKCAIVVPQYSAKNLILYADVNIRATHTTELLYSFIQNLGNLTIGGTGSLNVSFNASGYPSAILFNQGTLTIEDDITLDPTSYSFNNQFGYSIWHETGYMTIHGGTFNGYKSSAVLVNRGDGRIYDGTFNVLAGNDFGLCIHTQRKASEVDFLLYGGTFQGICASQVESGDTYLKLPSLLPYGAKYREYLNDDWYIFNSNGLLETNKTLRVEPATEIGSVAFTVTAPKDGQSVKFIATDEEKGYLVSDVEWLVSDTGLAGSYQFMKSGDSFVGGKYYKVRIYADASSKNYFAYMTSNGKLVPNVSATINGQQANAETPYEQDPREQILVSLDFGICNTSIIKSVAIVDVQEPVPGEYPDYSANCYGTGYFIEALADKYKEVYTNGEYVKRCYYKNGIIWYDVTDPNNPEMVYADQVFEVGHDYMIKMNLSIEDTENDKFYLDGDYNSLVTATLNGEQAEIRSSGNNSFWNQILEHTFKWKKKEVSEVEVIGLSMPVSGATPDYTVTTKNPMLYTISNYNGYDYIHWYDENGGMLEMNHIFEAGRKYQVEMKLVTANNNGIPASDFVASVKGWIDSNEVVSMDTGMSQWDGVLRANASTVYIVQTYTCEGNAASGVTVSGAITSYLDVSGEVTIGLYEGESANPAYTVTVTGNTVNYSIENVEAGTYTMKVSKANHVTREYEVVVASADVVQDVKIYLEGDVTNDGAVDIGDHQAMFEHLQGITVITDPYKLKVLDVTQDGSVDIGDHQALFEHLQGITPLF